MPTAVATRFNELWQEDVDKETLLRGTPEWDARVAKALKEGLDPVIILGNSSPHVSFHTLFATYVTSAWTAIETMAGDLWEAALNAHPESLSSLSGKANRLRKINKPSTFGDRGAVEPRHVRLDLIQMYQFDLRQKMGTILREKFEFSSLGGIREAYASAFHKRNNPIDAALGNDALDALSAVRNVIVHKAAIADAEYFKRTKYLKLPIGRAGIGALIPLDGQIVVDLIVPAIACGSKLLGAVDAWIVHERGIQSPK